MVTLVSTIASPFFFASARLAGHEPLLHLSKEVTKKAPLHLPGHAYGPTAPVVDHSVDNCMS